MSSGHVREDDSIVTVADLKQFKKEIIEAVTSLLEERPLPKRTWLKTKQVLKILGISPGKLNALRKSKQLPYSPLGGVYYYDEEDIERLRLENKVK